MNLFISNWDSNIVCEEHECKQVGGVSSKITTDHSWHTGAMKYGECTH